MYKSVSFQDEFIVSLRQVSLVLGILFSCLLLCDVTGERRVPLVEIILLYLLSLLQKVQSRLHPQILLLL